MSLDSPRVEESKSCRNRGLLQGKNPRLYSTFSSNENPLVIQKKSISTLKPADFRVRLFRACADSPKSE